MPSFSIVRGLDLKLPAGIIPPAMEAGRRRNRRGRDGSRPIGMHGNVDGGDVYGEEVAAVRHRNQVAADGIVRQWRRVIGTGSKHAKALPTSYTNRDLPVSTRPRWIPRRRPSPATPTCARNVNALARRQVVEDSQLMIGASHCFIDITDATNAFGYIEQFARSKSEYQACTWASLIER